MSILWLVLLLGGLGVAVMAARMARKRAIAKRMGAVALLLFSMVMTAAGGYGTWFLHRSQPPAAREQWFSGISYERVVVSGPRRMVAHIVRVDLDAPGVRLAVTPPDGNGESPLMARTTSTFAREHGVQVAINANFYFPFHASHPLNYYPHAGDRVQVAGFAAADGRIISDAPWNEATFYIQSDGTVGFERPSSGSFSAISGNLFLLRAGELVGQIPSDDPELYARTCLGLDSTSRKPILVVVEGKQPGRSVGTSIPELAEFVRSLGAHTAINLDGGGSSTLVRQTAGGQWSMVNCTSNFKMPWWERPVANHLGVFARPK